MGLLNAFKQYVRDAMPGGALNPEVTKQGLLDTAAIGTAPVPFLGDAVGLLSDLSRFKDNPEERTPVNIGLSALGVLPFVPSFAGMFVGKGSKTWDAVAAAKAQQLADKGVDQRQIWKETGTFKGPDGMWRQEIDDTRAGMRLEGPKFGTSSMDKMGEVVDHRDLYAAYPDTKNINATWSDVASGGSYSPVRSYAEYIDLPQRASKDAKKSTALHEFQHAIQQREGWARGGSPTDLVQESLAAFEKAGGWSAWNAGKRTPELVEAKKFADQVNTGPGGMLGAYQRLAGEAEARATQARMNMNMAQRRATFPLDSYDVPLDQLIIRKGLLD